MKNLLFITWDGPQTSYMEGLFLPIFHAVKEKKDINFHIIQFTWADSEKANAIQKLAEKLEIKYTTFPISRKPHPIIGSGFTVWKGIKFIKNYILKNQIDTLMPRSTMPALMVNRIKKSSFGGIRVKGKLIFDADGLPLEERIDFVGLSEKSKQYRFLKSEESKIIQNADVVITRSHRSIQHHLDQNKTLDKAKFHVVLNGRNSDFFKPDSEKRILKRKELNINIDEKVFVYCGSLGAQYGWKEMTEIVEKYKKNHPAKFLILTGNTEFAEKNLPESLKPITIILSLPFEKIPEYLNIADVAFAIRDPKPSMKGVSPIKLGEYLLMNLPTIASSGIGDTDEIISQTPDCFIFDHQNENKIEKAVRFVEELKNIKSDEIRTIGKKYFSLEKSAESYIKALNTIN